MKCGNRNGGLGKHEHATAAEVRACYGFGDKAEEVKSRAEVFGEEVPDVPVVGIQMASEKQMRYLNDLLLERGMDPIPEAELQEMARSLVSARISQLLILPPAEIRVPATVDYKAISAGFYAIPGRDGRPLDFYKVERPDKGKWAGHIFLKMVVGGKPDFKIRDRARIAEVLAAIAVNPDEAAYRYGQEIRQCNKCNIPLTDETSRMYSRGPDCRKKYGIGYMEQPPRQRSSRPEGLPRPAARPRRMAS